MPRTNKKRIEQKAPDPKKESKKDPGVPAGSGKDRRPLAGSGNGIRPMVAIGASAGGLEAILTLLENLPSDTGAAYVIIQHLSPSHESILPELLERKSSMPVHKVEDGMAVEENNVYVIPPNKYLSIEDSHLLLSPREKQEAGIHSIDHFLTALAPIYQGNAIAVILSGTANDGTAGIRAIKAEGGITFAQDDTAKFTGMPYNAAESGYVDFILSPERIAAELSVILKGLHTNDLSIENIGNKDRELRIIHLLLLNRFQVDFTLYKQTTIIRRIIRRIALNRLDSLEQYISFLRDNPKEADLLYKDLLINVTSFFREPSMFTALSKKIFPILFKGRKANDPIRIWVPACATGEEPYSIAICLFEYLKDKAINTAIQIFATDLSESAIHKARTGIYSRNTLMNMPAQRLRKFFIKIGGSFQVIKPIRDMCIFSTHNLLRDPPFSRMDLISCQNVLIYMEPAAQKKIMQAFHYGLNPDRFLLLGKSETVGASTDLFEPVDKDLRIYSRKAAPANMQFEFSIRNPSYLPMPDVKDDRQQLAPQTKESDMEKEAERLMFSHYMPASVLVNKDLQILRFYGSTFSYLQPASGKASLHLLKMIRDELIFELRNLFKQVKKEGRPARKEQVALSDEGQLRYINLEVLPVKTSASDPCLLIVFQPSLYQPPIKTPKRPAGNRPDEKDRRLASMDTELKDAREHVKSITEDFEATREELQSANEEVLSSNEELQSINEELETSKEELQSTNEELVTINEELQLRNNDLKESVDFTKAIVETIREPLIVLNADLRILTANHAFYSTFHLSPDEAEDSYLYEAGNRMFDIPEMRVQLKKTITKNSGFVDFAIQHPFPTLGNKSLQCNAMRMAGESGKKSRVLLAIEDISEQATAKKALYASEERFRHVSESGFINIMFFHPDGRIVDANNAFLELVGYTRADMRAGQLRWDRLAPPEWREESRKQIGNSRTKRKIGPYEKEYFRKDGSRFWALVVGAWLGSELGVEFVIDLTGRKEAEKELRKNIETTRLRGIERVADEEILHLAQSRFRMALEAGHMGAWNLDLQTQEMKGNQRHDQLMGYEGEEKSWSLAKGQKYLAAEDKQRYEDAFKRIAEEGSIRFEGRIIQKNGNTRWIRIYGQVLSNGNGNPPRAEGVILDITDQKTNGIKA
jgi:two-component system CheB/CheR fusion protein